MKYTGITRLQSAHSAPLLLWKVSGFCLIRKAPDVLSLIIAMNELKRDLSRPFMISCVWMTSSETAQHLALLLDLLNYSFWIHWYRSVDDDTHCLLINQCESNFLYRNRHKGTKKVISYNFLGFLMRNYSFIAVSYTLMLQFVINISVELKI